MLLSPKYFSVRVGYEGFSPIDFVFRYSLSVLLLDYVCTLKIVSVSKYKLDAGRSLTVAHPSIFISAC